MKIRALRRQIYFKKLRKTKEVKGNKILNFEDLYGETKKEKEIMKKVKLVEHKMSYEKLMQMDPFSREEENLDMLFKKTESHKSLKELR